MNDLRDTERRLSNLLHDTTPEPPASIDLREMARTAKEPAPRKGLTVVRRWAVPLVAAAAVIGSILGGIAIFVGGVTAVPGSEDGVPPEQVEQAQKALAHWRSAVQADPALTVLPTLQQVGEWEPGLAAKYSQALAARQFKLPIWPSAPQHQDKISWASGDVRPTAVLSSNATYNLMLRSVGPCRCTPIVVTGAVRTTMKVQTTLGTATVPAWRFSLKGTRVQILHTAIPAPNVRAIQHDPYSRVSFHQIDRAVIEPDDRTITAEFVGAVDPGSKVCGEDYTATAVEAADAVVIIVTTLPSTWRRTNPDQACNTAGRLRTATIELDAKLTGRPVIQLRDGIPAPLARK